MNLSSEETREMFQIVENLMEVAQIPMRDTWKGIEGYNYDDYYVNNKSFNGKKQFKVVLKEEGMTDTGGKKYSIPGFECVAYDGFEVRVPKRLIGMRHNIIHEIVHFLQENNDEEESRYISFNGNNYREYVSQKLEFEAHYVQLLFIYNYELKGLKLDVDLREEFESKVQESIINKEKRLYLILFAKTYRII